MHMSSFIVEYWPNLVTIVISVIPTVVLFSIKGRISHWFNKDLESHKAELDRKNQQIQASLDTKLEIMRIEFGLVQSERLQILKEACNRLTKILNQITAIASYYEYDCKENVDYKTKCNSDLGECHEDCIINYWKKIVEFDKYTRETLDFFENNQMFFPMEIAIKHLKIITLVFNLRKGAYDINSDLNKSNNEKALATFKLFYQFDKDSIIKIREELVEEYRLLIGVAPLKSYSVEEYRLWQKLEILKNRSINPKTVVSNR